jgi:hypothetical protein
MIEWKVMVVSPEGVVLDVEKYIPLNDGRRAERVAEAAAAIAKRLNIPAPELFHNSVTDSEGREWGKTSAPIEPGMVEVGFGKWGFARQ